MIDWLNDNSGAVQAVSAIVLALTLVAVAYYAYQSRNLAREAREQRLLAMRPILLLSPLAEETELGSGHETIRLALKGPLLDTTPVRLTNVGSGIAVGIRVPYKLEGESPKERVVHYLPTGSDETESHFHLRPVESSNGPRILRVTYYDVFGNCYESTSEFHKDPGSNHYLFTRLVHREVAK